MNLESHTERLQLPTGIQTFSTLRNSGCYDVDKTLLIRNLIRQGRYYFLSRPRRFGKSLLISTLLELFEGNEPLFRGLDIHQHWDWLKKFPVVRLSFDGNYQDTKDLEADIFEQFDGIEEKYKLASTASPLSGPQRLRNLLRHLHRATGQQVVVLIDEYDKPILNDLEKPGHPGQIKIICKGSTAF